MKQSSDSGSKSLLDKGLNYAIALRHPPNLENITAIESMYTKLGQQEVEEIRADANRVLKAPTPSPILVRQKQMQ